jgi:hypothetical protein
MSSSRLLEKRASKNLKAWLRLVGHRQARRPLTGRQEGVDGQNRNACPIAAGPIKRTSKTVATASAAVINRHVFRQIIEAPTGNAAHG